MVVSSGCSNNALERLTDALELTLCCNSLLLAGVGEGFNGYLLSFGEGYS